MLFNSEVESSLQLFPGPQPWAQVKRYELQGWRCKGKFSWFEPSHQGHVGRWVIGSKEVAFQSVYTWCVTSSETPRTWGPCGSRKVLLRSDLYVGFFLEQMDTTSQQWLIFLEYPQKLGLKNPEAVLKIFVLKYLCSSDSGLCMIYGGERWAM